MSLNDGSMSKWAIYQPIISRAQLEREERNKKRGVKDEPASGEKKSSLSDSIHQDDLDESQDSNNSTGTGTTKKLATDCDDPNTTNIFISNLSPKVSFI